MHLHSKIQPNRASPGPIVAIVLANFLIKLVESNFFSIRLSTNIEPIVETIH